MRDRTSAEYRSVASGAAAAATGAVGMTACESFAEISADGAAVEPKWAFVCKAAVGSGAVFSKTATSNEGLAIVALGGAAHRERVLPTAAWIRIDKRQKNDKSRSLAKACSYGSASSSATLLH